MATHEVLVFKQMDTRDVLAQCVFHSSFDDPTSPPEAPGRRSIETRILCAFVPQKSTKELLSKSIKARL